MPEQMPVVIVGAGHAGLALSHELAHDDIDHVVLERAAVGQSWRTRWDSFCLVTPNWTFRLPGGTYDGTDPDGFMPRDEIVGRLERYAQSFRAPIREGIDVSSVDPGATKRFLLRTSEGEIETDAVVMAAGGYQKPHRPPAAASLPARQYAIDAEGYTNPDALPPGKVLVVGSGQTGCQLAEELHDAGRDVTLACGRAPWTPRRLEGRDIVSWVVDSPFVHQTVDDLPAPAARLVANFQTTGHDGGHDLHYRTLVEKGVTLAGHMVDVEDNAVVFADDLAASVAFGDARYHDIASIVEKSCLDRGESPPHFPTPEPFTYRGPERLDLKDCGTVIFTSGFRPDFASWIRFPNAFDEFGFPLQTDGESSVVPGLYFMGVHFMRKRISATLVGAADDAAAVAGRIAVTVRRTGTPG